MRVVILALFALSLHLAGSVSLSGSKQARWSSYKANSGLTFADSAAEAKASAAYWANLDFIEQWNNDPTKTFKIGENNLAHLSNADMKNRVLMRTKSSAKSKLGNAPVEALPAGLVLKPLVNYTDYFGPVKDQANCGSCYAFTTTGVVESQYFMKYGVKVSLSEEQILDCTATAEGPNSGCDGGDDLFSLAYVRAVGLCSEQEYAYTAFNDYYDVVTGQCQTSTIASCNPIKIKNYGLVTATSNEFVMAAYIQAYGPITGYIDASAQSFQLYKSGIYDEPACSTTNLDHTVVILGFGTDSTGQDYWILRNSWGPTWGMNGYMLLARNKGGVCGIAASPYYAKF